MKNKILDFLLVLFIEIINFLFSFDEWNENSCHPILVIYMLILHGK
jgi:hypothetical protein